MHLAMRPPDDDVYGRAAAGRAERTARIGIAAGALLAIGGTAAWGTSMRGHVGPILTLWGLATGGTCMCVANTRSALRARQHEILDALDLGALAARGDAEAAGDAEVIDLPARGSRRPHQRAI